MTNAEWIQQVSFRNPFWSVPASFCNDSGRLRLADQVGKHRQHLDLQLGFFLVFLLPSWAITGVLYFFDFRATPRDEYGNYLNPSGVDPNWWTVAIFWISAIVSVIVFAQSVRHSLKWRRIRRWIFNESLSAYQMWLQSLAVSNPARYAEILGWEQRERQIRAQELTAAINLRQLEQQQRQQSDLQRIQADLDKLRKHHRSGNNKQP